ncbi:MAG: ABC transporter ATP-binding protein [Lachnospiraceae bacterium]|nr:ABC transporter ATP-binding protein [Lachnospiraceae bacterium]
MPEIKLRNITKRWGKFYAVDHLSLDIDDNSFITLLGPSGCGKTTILRMIAGLETPTTGQITIGNRVVFDSDAGINIPANKRKVGFLFQNYALWPNMKVYQNISFGLNNIKEELPEYDFTAKKLQDMIRVLRKPEDMLQEIEECKDKKGKIDTDKVYLKLIDTYIISMQTAKELYALKLQETQDPTAQAAKKVAEYQSQLDAILKEHTAKGETLDQEFAIARNGKIQTSERKLHKEEIDLAVRRVARVVKIGMFMDRYPAELSGGQQQRVAIARTLAPKPQVLFMDEPLSNLDAKLRLEMRYELQRLHLETGSTFVYVTHDQMEAMTLATKICLINNGVLQQYDAPLDVYNRPKNQFAADFVGNPSINFIDAKGSQQADGGIALSIFDGTKVTFHSNEEFSLTEWIAKKREADKQAEEAHNKEAAGKKFIEKGNRDEVFKYHISKVDESDYSIQDTPVLTDEDFVLGVRPEWIGFDEQGALRGEIFGAMPTGMESTIKVAIGGYLLTSVVFGKGIYRIGEKQNITFKGNDILLFDRKTGTFIAAGSVSL